MSSKDGKLYKIFDFQFGKNSPGAEGRVLGDYEGYPSPKEAKDRAEEGFSSSSSLQYIIVEFEAMGTRPGKIISIVSAPKK